MKNKLAKVVAGLIILFICALVIYIILDNNRITIAKQDVLVDHLSKEFEGYKILQITDLHGKEFGKNQSRLLKSINSINYDAIVFTGDMVLKSQSTNIKPFYQLLDGLKNKENAIYIPGNEDPESYYVNSKGVLVKSEFVKGIEKRGVKFLESVYSVKKSNSSINFVDFETSILEPSQSEKQTNGIFLPEYSQTKQYFEHRKTLMKEISGINHLKKNNVLIALNHYPIVDTRIDTLLNDSSLKFKDRKYDLIIAGHYHGGQIRLPFIGAPFVPEGWYKWGGLFPPQNRVKGLWEYKHTKQYVSTGLGSSNFIPFLKFRLFNPPEINILTLKQKK
ncbi:metallophosphoesterase [Gottfriedia acidiceleris]|uniref:Metallophosphoesterase n=1 Tax=Gottfriedia acidiceleris TaxID=371036 RepID=A0ABY4JJX2_9BACI|nr:metallophosphoesterase [Gottfriedia acidiceleris]UPM54151.1 metallophosphoesterase [Gottfriedia acidiceleris]